MIGPPRLAVPVSVRVSGFSEASAVIAGQLDATVVLPQPKKNGNALNALRRNR